MECNFKEYNKKLEKKEKAAIQLIQTLTQRGYSNLWNEDGSLSRIAFHKLLFLCCVSSNEVLETSFFHTFDNFYAVPYKQEIY